MEEIEQFEFTKEFLERFGTAVSNREDGFIKESLEGVNPADVSTLLNEFNAEESKWVMELLDTDVSAQILNDLDSDTRVQFLKGFESNEIARYVEALDSDDAADILNEQPVQKREEVIANIANLEKAGNILDLLRYEEDCAGGLMAKELIKANVNWTINKCIEEIRRQAGKVNKVYSIYVVDDVGKLLGRVSLRRIVLANDQLKISDIYDDEVFSVETYMDKEEVALLMQKYDLEAIPVVNVNGKLVGRITIDDIVDVITEMAEQERQIMSGISEDVEEDDSIWLLTRARLPWLMIGLIGGLIAAIFIQFFDEEITLIPALAFFIPLIMATGGNVGIQSSSIIVQSLAHRPSFGDQYGKRLFKIFFVALLNGLVLGLLSFLGIGLLLGESYKLAFIVSLALFSVVVLASFMGTMTPIILDRMNINPALASGPFITTTNDLLGLAIYLGIIYLLYFR